MAESKRSVVRNAVVMPSTLRRPEPLGGPRVDIPSALSDSIRNGNCVAFVGAGFSAGGGLPRWSELLRRMTESLPVRAVERRQLDRLVSARGGPELEKAAQVIEDRLGRDKFIAELTRLMGTARMTAAMKRRLYYLTRIPFRAILTTNFDRYLLAQPRGAAAYRAVLRPESHRWWERRYWADDATVPPTVVKLHGDLDDLSDSQNIVITRRDYRRRLYSDPAYATFLRAALATTTVLYVGFSFADEYLNELRSEILAMFAYHAMQMPISYAVVGDAPDVVIDHFKRHEGVELLTYDTRGGIDHRGFDSYLEALYLETNPVPRFARTFGSRRILWVDPRPYNNAEAYELFAKVQADKGTQVKVIEVDDAARALTELGRHHDMKRPVDLVITHWGSRRKPLPTGLQVLHGIRRQDLRVPVIVFSSDVDASARRSEALALGAYAYCYRFGDLFQEMERLFTLSR